MLTFESASVLGAGAIVEKLSVRFFYPSFHLHDSEPVY